jgi:proline iminopeptidase
VVLVMDMNPIEATLKTRNVTLRYRIAGNGPVLLMQSPGWGVGAELYERTMKPLEERFTVVYYDPRGSGKSSRGRPEELNVGTFVEDLEALRKHLGLETFALMGHSHGGLIALHYAAKHPNRVSHLIPLDAQLIGHMPHCEVTEAHVQSLPRLPAWTKAMQELQEAGGFGALFSMTTDEEFSRLMRIAAPIYFRDPAVATDLADYFDNGRVPLATVQNVSASDGNYPVMGILKQIRAATLVVAGLYDPVCPASTAVGAHSLIAGSKLAVFDQSAHFPWVEEPDKFFATVSEFLQAPLLAQQS